MASNTSDRADGDRLLFDRASEIARAMQVLNVGSYEVDENRRYVLVQRRSSAGASVYAPALRVDQAVTHERRWWYPRVERRSVHLVAGRDGDAAVVREAWQQFSVDYAWLRAQLLRQVETEGTLPADSGVSEVPFSDEKGIDVLALEHRAAVVDRSIARSVAAAAAGGGELGRVIEQLVRQGREVSLGALTLHTESRNKEKVDVLRAAAAEVAAAMSGDDVFHVNGRTYVRLTGGPELARIVSRPVGISGHFEAYVHLTVPPGMPTDGTYPWQIGIDTRVRTPDERSVPQLYAGVAEYLELAEDLLQLRAKALQSLVGRTRNEPLLNAAVDLLNAAGPSGLPFQSPGQTASAAPGQQSWGRSGPQDLV